MAGHDTVNVNNIDIRKDVQIEISGGDADAPSFNPCLIPSCSTTKESYRAILQHATDQHFHVLQVSSARNGWLTLQNVGRSTTY